MGDEEWRPLPGWPYGVSSKGRVRRTTSTKAYPAGHVLSPTTWGADDDPEGTRYQYVSLWRDGTDKTKAVHQLVARVFIGERPDGYQIDHINGRRDDNRVENLRYVPIGENTSKQGEDNGRSKLTRDDVVAMRRRYQLEDVTQRELAEEYDVSQATVSGVLSGKKWSHVQEGLNHDE